MNKIAIIGTGGVGGYFGAKLARAGYDVSFLARGAHMNLPLRWPGIYGRESHLRSSIRMEALSDWQRKSLLKRQ